MSAGEGTELMRIRVEGSLVSFKWLKEQDMLQEGATPRCVKPGEVFPDFTETATAEKNEPHFSEDGVFTHELRYYLPGHYCVDGERDMDDWEEEYQGGEQAGYLKVVVCEEKGEDVGVCKHEEGNCYPRLALKVFIQ